MPTLETNQRSETRLAVALRWIICLLLLLVFFCPRPWCSPLPLMYTTTTFTVWEDSDDSENQLDVLANDDPLPGIPFVIVGRDPGHPRQRKNHR